ncbi:4048_t:CDS:2 [Cetraspora pellucida]|uniref:4048_t:CDS:1 n=1 Tax=Cetraspora pellucida TaxID=1433469 RepID=A0A9N8ZDC4_9GLOM|nr:4048_t:CDS:2 [Cetraspora pellucida]
MGKKYLYMQHAPIFLQKINQNTIEDENLQSFLLSQPFDESFASSKKQSWAWKYFRREKNNIEIKFGICNVTDKLGKIYNARLKILNGSTKSLIFHLLKIHDIMQNNPGQDNTDK